MWTSRPPFTLIASNLKANGVDCKYVLPSETALYADLPGRGDRAEPEFDIAMIILFQASAPAFNGVPLPAPPVGTMSARPAVPELMSHILLNTSPTWHEATKITFTLD
jgi:hypothetical protein